MFWYSYRATGWRNCKGAKVSDRSGCILKSEKQVFVFFFFIIINIILGRRLKDIFFFHVCNDDVKKLYKDSKDRNE